MAFPRAHQKKNTLAGWGAPMGSQGGPLGPWALGTPGPWAPLGLGDPWALGTIGPWGPWALGTLGPWGSLGLGDPWALGTLGARNPLRGEGASTLAAYRNIVIDLGRAKPNFGEGYFSCIYFFILHFLYYFFDTLGIFRFFY